MILFALGTDYSSQSPSHSPGPTTEAEEMAAAEHGAAEKSTAEVALQREAEAAAATTDPHDAEQLYKRGSIAYHSDGDKELAADLYRQAAEKGHPRAQADLGWMLMRGEGGLERSELEATVYLRRAARAGVTAAMTNLALLLEIGKGRVRRDEQRAAQWYLRAAKGGEALAQNNVAAMYTTGRGVDKDLKRALKVTTCL